MKRIVLSALSAFVLCLLSQTNASAQVSFGVVDSPGSYPDAHLFDGVGGPGPGEFMTQPEVRAFGPSGDENGPTAPFYAEPMYNYTGWFRPRAVGVTQAERCYAPDTFRPRGLGRLYARRSTGVRMDYQPFSLASWNSVHGPAYYQLAEDPRCPHCDKQGCCLFGACGACGSCGTSGCDGGCDNGGCDSCDDGGCRLGGTGWSQWITRPKYTNRRQQRVRPRVRRQLARAQGCLDGSCGQTACNSCAQNAQAPCASCNQNGCAACGTAAVQAPANSCGCQTQSASNDNGFIRHNAATAEQQFQQERTAYEEAAAGVIN